MVEERYLTTTLGLTKQERIPHNCHISPPRELNVHYLWKLHISRPSPSCTLSGRITSLRNNGQMKPHLQHPRCVYLQALSLLKNRERKHQNLRRVVSGLGCMFMLADWKKHLCWPRWGSSRIGVDHPLRYCVKHFNRGFTWGKNNVLYLMLL